MASSARGRLPLRLKLALAAFAGLVAAWVLPRGGGTPVVEFTPSPSDRPGVTAFEVLLTDVPEGVTFRTIDGVRVFLVRTGNVVEGFHGAATTAVAGPVWWCPRNGWFEGAEPGPYYDSNGAVLRFSAPRNLDHVSVLSSAGRVTIFPKSITPGDAAPEAPVELLPPAPPAPCSPAERVG